MKSLYQNSIFKINFNTKIYSNLFCFKFICQNTLKNRKKKPAHKLIYFYRFLLPPINYRDFQMKSRKKCCELKRKP